MIAFDTARRIDRKIGKPLCGIVGLLRRFRGKKNVPNERIRKILIIKMWGLGTIVLASPVFANLKRNLPDCKIYFMTLRQNRDMYEGSPHIDGAVYFDMSGWLRALRSFLKLVVWMWRQQFDVVFDFEIGSRFTALLTAANLRSMTIGYAPAGSGKNVFDITIPYIESTHMTRIYLRSLDALNMKIYDERLLKLPIKIEEKQYVNDFVKSQRLSNFVAFNPNTSDLAIERLWPPEYFAELGKRLLTTFPDLQIVLIGAKADVVRVMGLQKSIEISDRVVSTAGKFTIRETTELLSHARVLVSNDSGPMHLGVVAGVPTVGLFGPETPVLYGPRGDNHIAITAGEMCSPCISVYNEKVVDCCRGVVCMKNISVESVFQAVVERLAAVQPNVTFREFSELPLTKQRIDS